MLMKKASFERKNKLLEMQILRHNLKAQKVYIFIIMTGQGGKSQKKVGVNIIKHKLNVTRGSMYLRKNTRRRSCVQKMNLFSIMKKCWHLLQVPGMKCH